MCQRPRCTDTFLVLAAQQLFLATSQAQLVVSRVWLGRAVDSDSEEEDEAQDTPAPPSSSGPDKHAGSRLARLVAARRSGSAPLFWCYAWPLLGGLALPLISLLPPQLLRESIFKPLYTPQERYWTTQVSYVTFIILVFHLNACDSGPGNCTADVGYDLVLVAWLFGLLGAEAQAAWHVARAQAELGRPIVVGLQHLHTANLWKRFDFLGVLVALAAAATRAQSRLHASAPETDVRAVASVLLWSRLLSTLSMHVATGPLLASIRLMVVKDISRYCILQVLIITTFAAAFAALYNGEDSDAGI